MSSQAYVPTTRFLDQTRMISLFALVMGITLHLQSSQHDEELFAAKSLRPTLDNYLGSGIYSNISVNGD